MRAFLGAIGRRALVAGTELGEAARLVNETVLRLRRAPFSAKGFRRSTTVIQMVKVGVDSMPIVFLIAYCVGMILALQAAVQLKRFGATIYVADLVGITLTRELGPLMTAIIIAGRSGSAMASEIGTMRVSEELDALKAMAINPVDFLVLPRLLALVVMLPCLSVLADVVGILGGMSVALMLLDFTAATYLDQTVRALLVKDVLTGLVKSGAFAVIIALVGCFMGFRAEGGAEGVGQRTTASVVVSVFLLIVADLFFTGLFYLTE
jgi:phospholipid/cholesterol/gamma-HCH transport system permease protein